MRSHAFISLMLLLAFLLAIALTVSEARGGRRGGGSFGGFLGGWRKYKKPASAGNSRRTTNGSPMHTTITKSSSSGGDSSGSSLKASKHTKAHASHPKQEFPAGAAQGHHASGASYHANNYYGAAAGAAYVPPSGTYYANTALLPAGAIYYAQPPMRPLRETDFLFGLLTSHALFSHRPHMTHVYQQSSQPAAGAGSTTIVINGAAGGNNTEQHFWPSELDVPLAPFNATITTPEMLQTGKKPIFQRTAYSAPLKSHPLPLEIETPTTQAPHPTQVAPLTEQPVQPVPPSGGIICIPMLFNETDPNDPSLTESVKKIICYPAPPPPEPSSVPLQFPVATDTRCITRTLTERDPSDPTKSIEIQQQECAPETIPAPTTTSTPLPPVAGDIGEGADIPLPE